MKQWEKIGSEVIFEHPRITLVEDQVRLPGGEETKYLVFAEPHDFPTIIATRTDGKILVTEEYAYPINEMLWQFPEGLADEGEDMLAAAHRELLEETGYASQKMSVIGSVLHNHRRMTARQYVVLATDTEVRQKANTDLEEGEIRLHWYDERKIWDLIATGKMIQKNALAAWAVYQANRKAS